jgi:chemotaxis protein MotB
MDEQVTKKGKGDAPAAGWEVIYTSLVLILVALFAMLASYSSVEGEKVTNFLRGFVVISEIDTTSLSPTSIRRSLIGPEGGQADLRTLAGITKDKEQSIATAMKSLKEIIEDTGLDDAFQITETESGFKATFGNGILFPSGAATINEDAYSFLDQMIKIAQNAPFTVRVEGHTDNIPINTDKFPSNWELSTSRAVNVLRYFISKGKISAGRVAVVGFSQYHPVASNNTPAGREKNRRVEFYFELHQVKERGDTT